MPQIQKGYCKLFSLRRKTGDPTSLTTLLSLPFNIYNVIGYPQSDIYGSEGYSGKLIENINLLPLQSVV